MRSARIRKCKSDHGVSLHFFIFPFCFPIYQKTANIASNVNQICRFMQERHFLIFNRLRGLTRLHQCDSCNQDESGEERFHEQAACHDAEEKKKRERTEGPIKLLQVTKQVPDERGK